MTRGWDKEKYESLTVPDKNRSHDLPNRGRALYPLDYEDSWRARSFQLSSYVTGVLHTARISTVEVIMSGDK